MKKKKKIDDGEEPKKRTKINSSDSKVFIQKYATYTQNWDKFFQGNDVKQLMEILGMI